MYAVHVCFGRIKSVQLHLFFKESHINKINRLAHYSDFIKNKICCERKIL